MIVTCQPADKERINYIINEAAKAYEKVIPADCYHQPYMTLPELEKEMQNMTFFGWKEGDQLVGVIGLETRHGPNLIRHAYVLKEWQGKGIGSQLLEHIKTKTTSPYVMVGLWSSAWWAVRFYTTHGFEMLQGRDSLLSTYWSIPARQAAASAVMGLQRKSKQAPDKPKEGIQFG